MRDCETYSPAKAGLFLNADAEDIGMREAENGPVFHCGATVLTALQALPAHHADPLA